MSKTIEMDKLALVERLLIPIQNTSLTLRFILDGDTQISRTELMRGLAKIQANSERMSVYLVELKEGKPDGSNFQLPAHIQKLETELIASNTRMNSFRRPFQTD